MKQPVIPQCEGNSVNLVQNTESHCLFVRGKMWSFLYPRNCGCTRCKCVYYCGTACQKSHWKHQRWGVATNWQWSWNHNLKVARQFTIQNNAGKTHKKDCPRLRKQRKQHGESVMDDYCWKLIRREIEMTCIICISGVVKRIMHLTSLDFIRGDNSSISLGIWY